MTEMLQQRRVPRQEAIRIVGITSNFFDTLVRNGYIKRHKRTGYKRGEYSVKRLERVREILAKGEELELDEEEDHIVSGAA